MARISIPTATSSLVSYEREIKVDSRYWHRMRCTEWLSIEGPVVLMHQFQNQSLFRRKFHQRSEGRAWHPFHDGEAAEICG